MTPFSLTGQNSPLRAPPQSKNNLYAWQDSDEEDRAIEMMMRKQQTKERDGFCRRVDIYDGQVLSVDGTFRTCTLHAETADILHVYSLLR